MDDSVMKVKGIDRFEVESALQTLMASKEIESNPQLVAAARQLAEQKANHLINFTKNASKPNFIPSSRKAIFD